MKLVQQPANSPDFNILNLGFFAAIQSLQVKTTSKTIDELIGATKLAFDEMESLKLDNTWITFQKVMEMAMGVGGGNNYKLPHLSKAKLRKEGKLISNIVCDPKLVSDCHLLIGPTSNSDDNCHDNLEDHTCLIITFLYVYLVH